MSRPNFLPFGITRVVTVRGRRVLVRAPLAPTTNRLLPLPRHCLSLFIHRQKIPFFALPIYNMTLALTRLPPRRALLMVIFTNRRVSRVNFDSPSFLLVPRYRTFIPPLFQRRTRMRAEKSAREFRARARIQRFFFVQTAHFIIFHDKVSRALMQDLFSSSEFPGSRGIRGEKFPLSSFAVKRRKTVTAFKRFERANRERARADFGESRSRCVRERRQSLGQQLQ